MKGQRRAGKRGKMGRGGRLGGNGWMGSACICSPTACRELSSASSQQSSSTEKEDTAQVSKADTRWSQAQSGSR